MNTFIRSFFSHDLLAELSEKEIVIYILGKEQRFQYEPYLAIQTQNKKQTIAAIGAEAKTHVGSNIHLSAPFSHTRSFVADFYGAEKLLQYGVKETHQTTLLKPAPRIIMHQLDKVDGGLTNIETRVLLELAFGCGARDAVVYVGKKLNPMHDTFLDIKKNHSILV